MKKDCKRYSGCAVKITNQFCLNDCEIYDKQEETVSERVKMTEEQARDFIKSIFPNAAPSVLIDGLRTMKTIGYILPDPVEEAEEMFKQIGLIVDNCTKEERITLVWQDAKKIYEAYLKMKPYYEKHKGEKI